jgi:hypothetical protein
LTGGVTVAAAEYEESDADNMRASQNWHRAVLGRTARQGNEEKVTTLLLFAAFKRDIWRDIEIQHLLVSGRTRIRLHVHQIRNGRRKKLRLRPVHWQVQ